MADADLFALRYLYLHLPASNLDLRVVNGITRREQRESVIRRSKNLSEATHKMTVRSKLAVLVLEKFFKPVHAGVYFPDQFGCRWGGLRRPSSVRGLSSCRP